MPVSSALTRTYIFWPGFRASSISRTVLPRADLLLRRDRILEVEDQGIGRRLLGVFELALAVAGNEQE